MQRGFTLLELLVVLAILAGLTVIAVPWLGGGGGAVELKAEARKLAATLRHSQSEAIRLNQDASVVIDVEARSFETADGLRRHQFPENIDLELESAASEIETDQRGRIRFFPVGGATGGRITLRRDGQSQIVTVDWLTGGVSVARK